MTAVRTQFFKNELNDPSISKSREKPRRRRVQFQESENSIVHYNQGANKDTWYQVEDYKEFRLLWKFNQVKVEKSKDLHYCMYLMGLTNDNMEMYELFARRAFHRRDRLRKIVLQHQAKCRLQGLQDPDGAKDLSKSVSMQDQSRALKLADVNAQEALEFVKGSTYSPTATSSSASMLSSILGFDLEMIDPLNCTSALNCANFNLESREITYSKHVFSHFDDLYRDSFDDSFDPSRMKALGCDSDSSTDSEEEEDLW